MSKKKESCQSNPPPYNPNFLCQSTPTSEPPPYTPYSQNFSIPQPIPSFQPSTTNVTVYAPNTFDSGARFDMSRPVIPPPPPGIAPNAAQLAAMQGHNVVVTQRKADFWFGNEDF